jgi:hypothetical protein
MEDYMRTIFREKRLSFITAATLAIFLSAVAWAQDNGNLRLDKASFTGQTVTAAFGQNESPAEGGGLRRTGLGQAELTAINLAGDKAVLDSAEPVGAGASGGGGYLSGYKSISVKGGKITGNLASAKNGAFAHGGGLSLAQVRNIDLSKLEFAKNEAKVDGTGKSTSIAGHVPSATARGGALSVYNRGQASPAFVPSDLTTLTVSDTTFKDNKIESLGPATSSQGGAVAVLGHIEAKFIGSGSSRVVFANNKAVAGPTSGGGSEGGALIIIGNPFQEFAGDLPPAASFEKVDFDGNSAVIQVVNNEKMDARGGAISVAALNGKASFKDCVFVGNRLESLSAESAFGRGRARGGAIFSANGLLIDNATFKNNTGTAPGASFGGAIELGGTHSSIKNSVFESNSAKGGNKDLGEKYKGPVAGVGGAIYLNGQATVYGSSFLNNQASGLSAQGGAFYVGPRARLTLVDSALTGNQALGKEAFGGAVYVAPGGKVLIGVSAGKTVEVSGNKAGETPELAKPSGFFFAPPPAEAPKPPPAPGGRPPRPEPDDLIVNVDEGAELILSDGVYGEKAKVTKDGLGLLSLAGPNLAAAWNVKSGALKLSAEQGQGASVKATDSLAFAESAVLVLEPAVGQPHALEAGSLTLPKEIKIAPPKGPEMPKNHVLLKLSGKFDPKSLAGQKHAGTLTVGGSDRPYSLEWNDRGELNFVPGPAS